MSPFVWNFVLAGLVLGLAMYNVGKWLFKADDWLERLAEGFLLIADTLRDYGVRIIPDFLRKLAIKDISGAVKIVTDLIALAKTNPKAVVKLFDDMFERVFAHKLTDNESRAYLKQRIAEYESTNPATAKTAGLAPATN